MKTYTVIINNNNGTIRYYKEGTNMLHREDGPAVEYVDGTKYWYLNNKLHREDGPACEYSDGTNCWYLNGKRHREDGPAVEYVSGTKLWYLNDIELSEEEFNTRMNKTSCAGKVITIEGKQYKLTEIYYMKNYTVETNNNGTIRYYKEGTNILHREDGPALEYSNGDKFWYLNGELHREDGPAIERADGSKCWYLNGKCHREDGPACEWVDGSREWFFDGELHREDGPACEYASGTKSWYLNDIKLSETEFNKRMNKNSCAGKVITIEGKQYKLTEI